MYQIDSPEYFYLMFTIPIFILVFIIVLRWKFSTQKKFASEQMLEFLSPSKSSFKPFLKLIVFCFSIIFLTIGLVNPKIGTELESVKREGIDIVFAVDVSKSMLAEDVAPNRLEKSKRLVNTIIDQLISDRIGIVAYAGNAIPQLPITTDYSAAKMFLQSMNTNMLSSHGTVIDLAIDMSLSFFDTDDKTNKVLIIISDGEDHNQLAFESAKKAKDLGVKIFTLGVGSDKGSPIPIRTNGVIESYKKNRDNEVVITKRNADVLNEIASLTDGKYTNANDTQIVLDFIKTELKEIDKMEFEAKKFISYKDQFQLFLILGLILIILDVFLFEKKTSWIQNLNLFNEKK